MDENIFLDCSRRERLVEVLRQLQDLGWDKVKEVDPSFTRVQLVYRDDFEDIFSMQVSLPQDFPFGKPTVVTDDLPEYFDPIWDVGLTIQDIYEEFIERISFFGPARRILKELDKETWILDPEKPSGKHFFRRIVVQPGVSLQVRLDPYQIGQIPEMKFLGSDSLIKPLRAKFEANIEEYDSELGILDNLREILQIDFPHPGQTVLDDFDTECCICYCQRLDNHLAELACSYPKCNKLFHESCLFEWLQSAPNCQKRNNTLFGFCPMCEHPISCDIRIMNENIAE